MARHKYLYELHYDHSHRGKAEMYVRPDMFVLDYLQDIYLLVSSGFPMTPIESPFNLVHCKINTNINFDSFSKLNAFLGIKSILVPEMIGNSNYSSNRTDCLQFEQ
jgi:hypothetical protein